MFHFEPFHFLNYFMRQDIVDPKWQNNQPKEKIKYQ